MIESTGLVVTPCLCSVKGFVVVLLFGFLGALLGADEERKSVCLGRGSGAAVPADELGLWKLRLHSAEWASAALHRDVLTPELLRRLSWWSSCCLYTRKCSKDETVQNLRV